jgi:benzoate transport
MSTDILAGIRERPMGRFQIVTVALCLALNMLDGYDVLAMSFAAPAVRRAWSLTDAQLGMLLSAGLVGMAVGSIVISPLADRFGRRPIILLCLVTMMLGTFGSAVAQDFTQLGMLRVLTGLGIGGILASLTTLVAEYTPDRRRELAISVMMVGYAVGAALGGLIAVFLIQIYGWPGVFLLGGVSAAGLLPLVWFLLPESAELLLLRRPGNALARLNAILKRLHQPALAELPPPTHAEAAAVRLTEIFGPALRRGTVLICASFFLLMVNNYFVLSWMPSLLRDSGLPDSGAISGSLLMHVGAIGGGVTIGALASTFGIRRLVPVFMTLQFLAIMAFATIPRQLGLLLGMAMFGGFFANGSVTGLYAIVPQIYPARLRATGTGLAIGLGRLGGIVSPTVAGVLMDAGWSRPAYCLALSLPLLLAAALVPMIRLLVEEPGALGEEFREQKRLGVGFSKEIRGFFLKSLARAYWDAIRQYMVSQGQPPVRACKTAGVNPSST